MARRRKEERRAGIASRGMVRRWGRFSSRVRHRVVPDRERGPDRCNASGSAVDVCSDAPAGAQRAERAVDGGVVYISRALSGSPRAPQINAQRVARALVQLNGDNFLFYNKSLGDLNVEKFTHKHPRRVDGVNDVWRAYPHSSRNLHDIGIARKLDWRLYKRLF